MNRCRVDGRASDREDRELPGSYPIASAGLGIEVRGAIALARFHKSCDQSGLRIDVARLPGLFVRAAEEYQRACETLALDRKARSCFAWESGSRIRLTPRKFPDFDDEKLAKWLREEAGRLCDALNETAPIPTGPEGRPSLNPEHWGIWPACDRTLRAWRHLVRMAELIRLAEADAYVRPLYETLPALRSLEPNLAVYRRLGIPVFRPREGHVFLAGRMCDLRARCLAAVGLRRGYVTRGRSRLSNHLLRERRPQLVVARELAEAVARHRPESGKADAERDSRGEYASIFDFGNRTGSPLARSRAWLRLTEALLETAPLGLPRSLQTAMLRNEYGLYEVTEAEVERLMALLADEVVYDLGPYLEDRTEDIVGSRSGLTANAVNESLIRHDHPDTSGAALRNRLRKGRRLPRLNPNGREGEGRGGARAIPARGRALYEYRALTLGGRPTIRASQAAVRQHEVLLAADEVMIEVAYALISGGFRLLSIADDEFVVEAPQVQAVEIRDELGRRASGATARVLGGPVAPVVVAIRDRW